MTDVTADDGLLSDTDLYVEDTGGDGRPVVLIHGWPLNASAWDGQVPALLDAGFRVVRYDRRGFGRSDTGDAYDYDTLADDLEAVLSARDLRDVTLVGFSMGGGEVARYVSRHGVDRLHSVVFASAVPPYLQQTDDNPDGPLDDATAQQFEQDLRASREGFFDGFTTDFYSASGELRVSDQQVAAARTLCLQSDEEAALGAMEAWATTDFRDDLRQVSVPTLVLHGDADGVVPFEGSGQRTHEMVDGARLHVIEGGPHGCNVSHRDEFNRALLGFLTS